MPWKLRLPLVCALAALVLAAPAVAQGQTTLRGIVGPGFNITLTHADGSPVTRLAPGSYTIVVDDRSSDHNFHLSGPGVDQRTEVEAVGTVTWTVNLSVGTYTYVCDPHAASMRGSFAVTAGTAPPPPPPTTPPPPANPPPRSGGGSKNKLPQLRATVGPGFTITLRNASGRRVTRLKARRYRIVVRDRSRFHNFHLVGRGVNRKTSVSFVGTMAWTVRFTRGSVYRFVCDPHRSAMRGSFRAT